jgi:hypothetical protein
MRGMPRRPCTTSDDRRSLLPEATVSAFERIFQIWERNKAEEPTLSRSSARPVLFLLAKGILEGPFTDG